MRQTLAVATYVFILAIVWFWDYLVALEAGFLSAWFAMLIWQSKYDWNKPYDVASRVVKIAFMWIMMTILGFFLFIAIGQISLLYLFNNNKYDAGEKLKRIADALKDYNSANGVMPPLASVSSNGKLMLSWRVHLLPYLNEQELYQRFQLDEPWDSPHNLALLPSIPSCYQFQQHARHTPKGHTFFNCLQAPRHSLQFTRSGVCVTWKKLMDFLIPSLQGSPKLPYPGRSLAIWLLTGTKSCF